MELITIIDHKNLLENHMVLILHYLNLKILIFCLILDLNF